MLLNVNKFNKINVSKCLSMFQSTIIISNHCLSILINVNLSVPQVSHVVVRYEIVGPGGV